MISPQWKNIHTAVGGRGTTGGGEAEVEEEANVMTERLYLDVQLECMLHWDL